MLHTFDLSTTIRHMTPLNIAVKDTDETVVEMILNHDISNLQEMVSMVAHRPTVGNLGTIRKLEENRGILALLCH